MANECHRELIAREEKVRKERFVADFVKKMEREYRSRQELERIRLRLQREEDSRREQEEMARMNMMKEEKERIQQEWKDLEMKKKEERDQKHRIELMEERRKRESCPFYRENFSKALQNSIHSLRKQEIQLKKEMETKRPETLQNKKRLRP